jgi:uncharacterized protein YcnI
MPSAQINASRLTQLSLIAFAMLAAAPRVAQAHAVVFPRKSAPGAYEKYVLRVPNEKDTPTTRVEIRFPAELRVVSFGDVAGWTLQQLKDSSGRITGAVWTGNLPPERFIEFPFVGVNPKENGRLVWPAFQTYADGERVDWTGPEDSKRPASATTLGADSGTSGVTKYVSVVALVLSLLSLGLALRPKTPA